MKLLSALFTLLSKKRKQRYIQNLISRGMQLGKNVKIVADFFFDPSHCYLIHIGDNCTICPNVRLIAHDASTKKILGYTKIGRIDIKENCFIGDSVIILPNVTIGNNTIIGSGSIVTRDIPPGCVAAGNPARVICTTKEYKEKIQVRSEVKPVFSRDYYIDRLTDEKRKEILESVSESIGYIV